MKYGKLMKRFGVAAFALTVASSCIVGGTLAKYTSTVTGTGSAIVAKWAPAFKTKGAGEADFSDTINVRLKDTTVNNKVADGKIAPGTSGSFKIQVSRDATEVAFKYSVTISNITNRPENLTFHLGSVSGPEMTETAVGSGTYTVLAETEMALTGGTGTEEKEIFWVWPYTGGSAGDASDTTAGIKATSSEADATMSFDINCTATQSEFTSP